MNQLQQHRGLARRPSQQLAARMVLPSSEYDVVETIALRLWDVGKSYRRYDRQWDRVKQWLWGRDRQYYTEQWAVRGVNLAIPRGKTIGILGANGSGKSTLLQLIAGTLTPNEGKLQINGRVAALLELGSGFHPEFTGWENVKLQAGILGISEEEIKQKLPLIAQFSELGEALDRPLRTYSTGMILRLGFSVAISVDPDILLVDEALAVGDMHFQQKCMARIGQLREQGVTIVLVTHDINTTKRLCDEAHVLEKGKIVQSGATEVVCNWYVARMLSGENIPDVQPNQPYRHGNQKAIIETCQLLNCESQPTTQAWIGSTYSLSLKVCFNTNIGQPVLGFYVRDRFGTEMFGINTDDAGVVLSGKADETVTVQFRFGLHVRPGAYTVCVGLVDDPTQPVCLDWIDDAILIEVHDPVPGRVVHGLYAEEIKVSAG
ncbi:MAG TPA: ABC transporter ATP-binding protein [Gemmatales bacterium]|nr:ABC transporter ATP-binding protein [Gemmatales bacterium]